MEEVLRILIIDDDRVDTELLRRTIAKSGFSTQVDSTLYPEEGLQKLNEQSYDLVFLDYRLPGIDGLEVLKKIRSSGIQTPIFIQTSAGDTQIAVDLMKAGATDYLIKGKFNEEDISRHLRYAIQLSKMREEKAVAEASLKEKEQQLKLVVESTPIILFRVDPHGIIKFLQGAGLSLLNVKPEEAVGKYVTDVFNHQMEIVSLLKQAKSGKNFVTRIQKEGISLETFINPEFDANGKFAGVMGVCVDVSRQVAAEEQLRKAKEFAEQTAKSKEEFLANMSHEIRTPMNAILGFSQLMKGTQLSPEQESYVRSISFAGDSLMVVIDDILDLSKIEAGKLELEKRPFRIRELVSSLVGIFKPRADEKGVRLIFLADDDLPEWIAGDPAKLNQILMNLVGNALKFTREGSITVSAEMESRQGESVRIKFRVRDTGIGIPEEKQSVIFNSFTQASAETTRKFGGTGLGLTICKKLVELQGGEIGVESSPGKGSEFYFHLTFEISAPGEDDFLHAGKGTGEVRRVSGMKILLVEDNALNQQVAKKVLENFGFTVNVASDGFIALEQLQLESFDVVLMDIQMPGIDGYETSRRIRKELKDPARSVPILALTAHAIPEEIQRCRDAGMNDIATKPFYPEALYNKIMALASPGKIAAERSLNENTEKKKPTSSELKFINLDYIREISGGNPEFLKEIMEMFLQRTPPGLEHLAESIEKGDLENTYKIAHTLKPSFVMFGLQGAQENFTSIEKGAKSGETQNLKHHLAFIQKMFLNCSREIEQVLLELV